MAHYFIVGTRILFKLSPDLFGREELKLFTNFPANKESFQRNNYHLVEFTNNETFNEETIATCAFDQSGTFHFRFTIDE